MKALKIIALVTVIAASVVGILIAMYKFTDILHSQLGAVRSNIKKSGMFADLEDEFDLPIPDAD